MADLVETILKQIGPSPSSDVVSELVRRKGLKPAAARQRVSRAGGEVRKLSGVKLPRNARFLYLKNDYGSPRFWNGLAHALIENKSALGFAIAALRQQGGVIPARQFPIICGSPVRQQKHLSAGVVLERLEEAGLVEQIAVPGVGLCVALKQEEQFYGRRAPELQARLIAEGVLLSAMRDWLRKLGFTSYNLATTRLDDDLPRVGTFAWDLAGPSYLAPMIRSTREGEIKPGFIACDVIFGPDITSAGASAFIRKCTTLRALHNIGPCLQYLVADRFDKDAFQALKAAGVVATTPSLLFGEEVSGALHDLVAILTEAAYSSLDLDKFEELFASLSKIDGAANQLRGTLFEFMVADVIRKTAPAEISMNRRLKAPAGELAEVDVLSVAANREITCIECKGYSPRSMIPDKLFKRWLHHNVPTVYKHIREHPDWRNLTVRFEFWSTAPISDEMFDLYEAAKSEIKGSRYTIELKGPRDVFGACLNTNDLSLEDAYAKHFLFPDHSIPSTHKARPVPSTEGSDSSG